MHVTLYFSTKRKADWDNFHKLAAMRSQIRQVMVAFAYEKENPRIEIAVAPL